MTDNTEDVLATRLQATRVVLSDVDDGSAMVHVAVVAGASWLTGTEVRAEALRLGAKGPDYVYLCARDEQLDEIIVRLRTAPIESWPPAEYIYCQPTSATQTKVAREWARTLNLPDVGLDDDIVDLGGDSLALVHLTRWAAEHLEKEFTIAELMSGMTVRKMADGSDPSPERPVE